MYKMLCIEVKGHGPLEKLEGFFEKRLNIFKIYECAPMQIGKGNETISAEKEKINLLTYDVI